MPNARGDGVSSRTWARGKWKIRWRERKAVGRYRNRSHTMLGSELDRDRVILEVRRALAESGTFEASRSTVLHAPPPPCSVADVLVDCIEARHQAGRYRDGTKAAYTSYAIRVVESLHRLTGTPEAEVVPSSVLSKETFLRLQELDNQRSASQAMRYAPLRLLLDAWGWAHDSNVEARENGRPDRYPGLPTPPRSSRDYLPPTPAYGRTVAPTIAHIDACLRHMPRRTSQGTRVAALFMRYTGLRTAQVFAIRRDDLDLRELTLHVRTGKTRSERADARTIPLASRLLDEPGVRGWIDAAAPGGPVFPKRRHARTKDRATAGRSKQATVTFRQAWEAATESGEVPRHVWHPPNRKNGRPEHSFRAAFQAFLVEHRVAGDVVDFLVGHAGSGVRETHYGRDLMGASRRAVECLPAVDWSRQRVRS